MTATILLLIIALVMFLLAGFGVSARVSWRDLGYASLVAAFLAANTGW